MAVEPISWQRTVTSTMIELVMLLGICLPPNKRSHEHYNAQRNRKGHSTVVYPKEAVAFVIPNLYRQLSYLNGEFCDRRTAKPDRAKSTDWMHHTEGEKVVRYPTFILSRQKLFKQQSVSAHCKEDRRTTYTGLHSCHSYTMQCNAIEKCDSAATIVLLSGDDRKCVSLLLKKKYTTTKKMFIMLELNRWMKLIHGIFHLVTRWWHEDRFCTLLILYWYWKLILANSAFHGCWSENTITFSQTIMLELVMALISTEWINRNQKIDLLGYFKNM